LAPQLFLRFVDNLQIHVDRYKCEMYRRLSDPLLEAAVTSDSTAHTRLHACERFARCEVAAYHNRNVVYLNPVIMSRADWAVYLSEVRQQVAKGIYPPSLKIAVARHSTMDELQSLVSIFKPKRVVPNTLNPLLRGLDWLAMLAAFTPHMAAGGAKRMWKDIHAEYPDILKRDSLTPPNIALGVEQDVSLDNAVTTLTGTDQVTSEPFSKRKERMRRLHSLLREARLLLQKECGLSLPPTQKDGDLLQAYDAENSSDCETDDSDNESAREALHRFMAGRSSAPASPARSRTHSPLKVNKTTGSYLPQTAQHNIPTDIENIMSIHHQAPPIHGFGPLDLNSPLSLGLHRKRKAGDVRDTCSTSSSQNHSTNLSSHPKKALVPSFKKRKAVG